MLTHNGPPNRFRDSPDLSHHFGKPFRFQGLPAIRKRFGWVGVDFNDQPICAGCNSRPCDRRNQLPVTGAVAGIEHNRKVGPGFKHRDRVDIGGVPG